MWVDNEDPLPAVTCLLRASESRASSSSIPQFLDVHLPFNDVGEGALSFQQRGCQLHGLFLFSAANIFVFPAPGGEMKDLREGKVWAYHLLVSRSPVRLHALTPLLSTDNEEDYRQLEQLTSNLQKTWRLLWYFFERGICQRCWRNSMSATLKDMA